VRSGRSLTCRYGGAAREVAPMRCETKPLQASESRETRKLLTRRMAGTAQEPVLVWHRPFLFPTPSRGSFSGVRAELNTKTGSLCDQTLDRRQAGAGCYSSTSCVSTRPQSSHLNVRSPGRPPNFGVILATVTRAPQAGQSGGKSFAFGGVGSSGAIKQKSTRQRLMI
jgi:hypothetical protein